MKNFKLEADNIKDELKQIRRTLHQYPELGFEETNTSKYIKEFFLLLFFILNNDKKKMYI